MMLALCQYWRLKIKHKNMRSFIRFYFISNLNGTLNVVRSLVCVLNFCSLHSTRQSNHIGRVPSGDVKIPIKGYSSYRAIEESE